jgi:hypothetical protein
MVRYARALLRLAVATALAVVGLAVAFVVAPAQASTGGASTEQTTSVAVTISPVAVTIPLG